MSSPSPGKRRMDTDVVKLYPLSNTNNKLLWPNVLFYHNCHVTTVLTLCVFPVCRLQGYSEVAAPLAE